MKKQHTKKVIIKRRYTYLPTNDHQQHTAYNNKPTLYYTTTVQLVCFVHVMDFIFIILFLFSRKFMWILFVKGVFLLLLICDSPMSRVSKMCSMTSQFSMVIILWPISWGKVCQKYRKSPFIEKITNFHIKWSKCEDLQRLGCWNLVCCM